MGGQAVVEVLRRLGWSWGRLLPVARRAGMAATTAARVWYRLGKDEVRLACSDI